jgi:hypothetical protein
MKKILVYFNLDMVGLGNGNLNMPGTEFAPEVYEFIKKNVDTTTLKRINWSGGGPGGSDHNHFLYHGVPAFAGMTAGSHPDYHQPGDDPEKISAGILQFTGDFIYHCAGKIANAKESFISEKRFDENIFKLITCSYYNPLDSKSFPNDLKNKNFRLAFVDFSDVTTTGNPKDNFISLLEAYDNASKETRKTNRYVLANSAYDVMNNRRGLLAAFNPNAFQYDELMLKALARYGYRLAQINRNAVVLKDTVLLKNLIKVAAENGIGLMLDNLENVALENVFSLATEPCLIYNSDWSAIPETMAGNIKTQGHLVVFQPGKENGVREDMNRFAAVMNHTGKDNIVIAPADFSGEGFDYFKQFLKQFNLVYPDKSFQSKVLTGNFYNLAVKSLQTN